MANKQKPHGTRLNKRGKQKTVLVQDTLANTMEPAEVSPILIGTPSRVEKTQDNDKTPTLKNNSVDVFTLEEDSPTVPTSDKPLKQSSTYKKVLLTPSTNPRVMSTFLLHKNLHDEKNTQPITLSDEETVEQENLISSSKFQHSVRMTMMFKMPSKKDGCSDEEAPKIAIQKMNMMLKTLTNKLPCKVGPWKRQSIIKLSEADLHNCLPEDIDFVESYVFDYNRFISPGKTGYVRLHIFYSDLTSLAEIKGVISQFKKTSRTISRGLTF